MKSKPVKLGILFVIVALLISIFFVTSRPSTTELTEATPITLTDNNASVDVPEETEGNIESTVDLTPTPEAVAPKADTPKTATPKAVTPVKVTIPKGTTVTTRTKSGTQTVTVNTDRVKVAVTLEPATTTKSLDNIYQEPGWKYDSNGKMVVPNELLPGWRFSQSANRPVPNDSVEPSVKPDWVTGFVEPKISWAGWTSCTRAKELTTHFLGGPAYRWDMVGRLKVTGGNFRPDVPGAPDNRGYPLVGPSFTYYVEVEAVAVFSIDYPEIPSDPGNSYDVTGSASWVPMNWNGSMSRETRSIELTLTGLTVPEGLCKG